MPSLKWIDRRWKRTSTEQTVARREMNYFQEGLDLKGKRWALGLAGMRWLALEGCQPLTLPHLLSEPTSVHCEK